MPAAPEADGAAARVAAAMLAPLAESAVAPPSRGAHGPPRARPLAAAARDAGAARVLPARRHAGAVAPAGRARGRAPGARARAHRRGGARTARRCRRSTRAGIAALEPSLGQRFAQGLLLPDEGQLDNRALLAALLATLQAMPDVRLHWHAPRSLDDFAPGAAGQPERVIDCRGLGARPQWNALRGVRGEVIRVHAPEVRARAADAPGASALPALHRAQARRRVRDRRDRDRIGRHVAGQRALDARTAERRLRGAQRLRRSAHPRDRDAVPADPARQPARRCASRGPA